MTEQMGPEDMALPELRLIQNLGGEAAKELGAKPGQVFVSLLDTFADYLDMAILNRQKVRTYWGRSEITDDPPECSSNDFVTSVDGKPCAECPFRADAPGLMKTDDRRASCLPGWVLLAVNLEDDQPMLIRAAGISAGGVRELNTILATNKALREAGTPKRAIVRVSGVSKKTPYGDSYAFQFRLKGVIEAERYKEIAYLESQIRGTAMEQLPEYSAVQLPEAITTDGSIAVDIREHDRTPAPPQEQYDKEQWPEGPTTEQGKEAVATEPLPVEETKTSDLDLTF